MPERFSGQTEVYNSVGKKVFDIEVRGGNVLDWHLQANMAGSYLYEPVGSIHTLHVPATNTEVTDVWFAIRGANRNLDEQGKVESVLVVLRR